MLMRFQKLEKTLKKCQQDVLKKKKLKMTGIKIIKISILKYKVPFPIRDQVKLSLHVFFSHQYTFTVSHLVCKCNSKLLLFSAKNCLASCFFSLGVQQKLLFTYHTLLRFLEFFN